MTEMMTNLLLLICSGLIVYHHVGYPLFLRWYAHLHPAKQTQPGSRGYLPNADDNLLPSVTVLMPAYNEAGYISEKIRNLASIDYPRNKLKVLIICDGCSDETAQIARATMQEAICADTFYEVIENQTNRGKVACLNEYIPQLSTDLCVLSDVSALISVDALLIAARHMANPAVGVVAASYHLLNQQFAGESSYWRYQQRIKLTESNLGSVLGCHGAFYLFRTELFEPLDRDTINDDFILPMRIIEKRFKAVYEPAMLAIELEPTDQPADFRRRLRISAGNMQQILRLWRLFSPQHSKVAFTFFSGKALRLLTPYLLLILLILPFAHLDQRAYQLLIASQGLFYLTALAGWAIPFCRRNKITSLVTYFVVGHSASLIGGWQYLLTGNGWRKKTSQL